MSFFLKKLAIAALWFAVPLCAQQVAITFDDLPEHGDLPPHVTRLQVAKSILATIREERLPPVYGFINAVALKDTPSEIHVLRAWRAAGQPLGSHTYSHADLSAITPAQYESDIAKNEPLLKQLMGTQDWRWFRYPYLREGDTLKKRDAIRAYLGQKGYRVAQVSLNFEDWAWNDPYARCSEKHDTEAIQWLHDSYLSSAGDAVTRFRNLTHTLYGRDIRYVLLLHIGPFDAKMFPELIALLRQRGFSFISLPEAMSDPAYSANPNFFGQHGLTFQEQVAATRHLPFENSIPALEKLDNLCK
ncbi:polysaccharide deacetylase family protein [Edaphobacter flagellatus]|uniref:polysaccharide deacetylase family protein n=1 Tax=Edaphobacter flagellatus TaxID=1933044 RepID=UPI0021B44396|nr:polysaccharide deacetylase family protein [Edaphobacter flagellatus]